MDQQIAERIRKLEQRVHTLTVTVVVLALGFALTTGLLPLVLVVFVVLFPILAFTHQRLPKIARTCGRLVSFARRLFGVKQPREAL